MQESLCALRICVDELDIDIGKSVVTSDINVKLPGHPPRGLPELHSNVYIILYVCMIWKLGSLVPSKNIHRFGHHYARTTSKRVYMHQYSCYDPDSWTSV